jgi:hypothetical protein
MFGEEFGLDYFQQRHTALIEAAEHYRLVQSLGAAQQDQLQAPAPRRRVLAVAGMQLVRVGNWMQEAAGNPMPTPNVGRRTL